MIINKIQRRRTVDSVQLHCHDGFDAVLLIITIVLRKIDKKIQKIRDKKKTV